MTSSRHDSNPSLRHDLTGAVSSGRSSSREDAAGSAFALGVGVLVTLALAAYAGWRRRR